MTGALESRRVAARRRILDAAASLLMRAGADGLSMGDVAGAAGVSKALVHYHFRDKERLLAMLADRTAERHLARAAAALGAARDAHVLDAYWSWLESELRAGDLRILISLAEYESATVREITRAAWERRREGAAAHVDSIFASLGLSPRIPAELLASTVVAFVDGLAISHALSPDRDSRPAFDALWLALLTLAE